jgi:hypothetical protein
LHIATINLNIAALAMNAKRSLLHMATLALNTLSAPFCTPTSSQPRRSLHPNFVGKYTTTTPPRLHQQP